MVLKRIVIGAIALVVATDAAAGERPGYSPIPDTHALLMRDQGATFDTAVASPRIEPVRLDVRGVALTRRLHTDIASFEGPEPPARAGLESRADLPEPGFSWFVLGSEPVSRPEWRLAGRRLVRHGTGPRDVVREGMATAGRARRFRHGSPLDSAIMFRFDGRDESPVLSVRGAVSGAIWRKLGN